jgi:glyoxylate reductase
MVADRVDQEFLDAAGEQLQVVANVAVGYNNIDVAACAQRGVVVTNTPDVLTDATADTAIALILDVTRRFGEGERLIRSGRPWAWGLFGMLGTGIAGATLGIIGPGAIGTATARRATAFGMEIAYAGRSPMEPAAESELGARRLDQEELLRVADVVSLHLPSSPQTRHLIGAAELASMKDTAFLINTARGPIVDEAALVQALIDGQIAGAGLDVFEREPTVHPGLLELDNVALYPHMGSATIQTRLAMVDLASRNALAVLAGEEPLTPVRASGA